MWAFALIGLVGVGLLAGIGSGDDGDGLDDVDGTAEDDVIDGGEGGQRIFGNEGDDVLIAGEDDDKAFGGDGSDLVFGEEGDDFLRGGDQSDLIFGGDGEDTLFGDLGDDILVGADVIDEDPFVERIRSDGTVDAALLDNYTPALEDNEADELNGGFGNDLLLLGGNDVASGGGNTDAFAVGDWISPDNPATITDFEPESETILFLYEGSIPPDAFITETDDGAAVALDDPDQPIVFLDGVDFLELTAANLVFEPIDSTVV